MRVAELRFAGSGRGDRRPEPRLRPSLLLAIAVLLVAAAALVLTPRSASAETRHIAISSEFGEDGTSGTTFSGLGEIVYQQPNDRLYVLTSSGVHGFSNPSAGTFVPLSGFPFSASGSAGVDADIAVDNTAGASANNIYVVRSGGSIEGYDSAGTPLAGWPVTTGGETCGVSVTPEGLVGGGNYSQNAVLIYSPAGSLVDQISGVGFLCKVTFDQVNGDAFVSPYGGGPIVQYTKASGYTESKEFNIPGGNRRVVVNSAKDVLYVMEPGTTIRAYDIATGELVEEFGVTQFGIGLAVDEDTDTVFVSGFGDRVQVLEPADVPKVITGEPVGNSEVSGTVDPDGAGEITECFFEFGETTGYGSTEECEPAAPFVGPNPVNVTAELPGLVGETEYNYRLVAANANGTNFGFNQTITPHNVTGLKTDPATAVTRTSATLNGSFEGESKETTYHFEWGTTTAYGNETAPVTLPSPGNPTQVSFPLTGLTANTTYHYRIVAENELGESLANDRSFKTLPAVSNVTTAPATNVTPSSATLNGSFDIDAQGGATSYLFEYGLTTSYGSTTATVPAGSTPGTPSVSQTVGVNEGVTYHFRIVVMNTLGTTVGADQTFTTPQPPQVTSATSSNVTATTADLIAEIDPNNSPTSYRFEYGTSPSYDHVAPVPDGSAGSGDGPVQVTVHIENLEVGAVYHFSVVAENEWGDDSSVDQTFSFFTANCPNAHVRQQSGAAYLPDCRAYELVSPEVAGPVQLFPGQGLGPIVNEFIPHPQPSNTGQASSPSRFAFWGGIGQINGTNPPNITQDLYVATRTDSGWKTHFPGLSASDSFASGGTNCSALMDRCVNYDVKDPLELSEEDTGSNAPYVFDSMQNSVSIGRFPTMVEETPGGEEFTGEGLASADYTHFGFGSLDVAFAPGGLTSAPGSAYDNLVAANTATVISKTPLGANIPQDPGGCTTEPNLQRQCSEEFIRVQALSTDGSHILMSNWAPPLSGEFPQQQIFADAFKRRDLHLTMRANGLSYDITQGARANFTGMSRDGTRVYFTSDEQVTPDDTDSSIDLFMWEESGDQVTRLSTGSGIAGNSDDCNVGWTLKETCGVQTPEATIERPPPGENPGQEIYTPDNWISENGEIYFYSPEQLDGGNGFGNARNLYVYRNGAPRYVATFDASGPTKRMQVSPDGEHMAFVTSTQVTGYENNGIDEMYSYEPATDRITCVSCIPTGAAPTSRTIASQNGLFMSDDGRTFFSTKDALVPFDTNGLRDVYEYVEGRPQLISSGVGNRDSWGGGLLIYPPMTTGLEAVSADGVDVYFSTFDTLVPQDQNGEFIKFYNARTGGGFPFSAPPPPCKAADECHAGGSVAPGAPQVGTSARLGKSGNVRQQKCKKGFKKKKGKCVKKKKSKKKKRKSKQGSRGR